MPDRRDSFLDACRDMLHRHAQDNLATIRNDVLRINREGSRGPMALSSIHHFAWLWKTRFPGNELYRDGEVFKTVVEMGDFLADVTLGDRKYPDVSAAFPAVGEWTLLAWMDAYRLIRRDVPDSKRRRWEAGMTRILDAYAEKVTGYAPLGRFNSYSFGTSPNHAVSYAIDLLIGGRLLGRSKWCSLAENFVDRFVAFQTPAGYWPEGHGPVGVYQTVSLAGVARFNELVPKKSYRETLARALDYHETISYPDHTLVAVVDRRQRYHHIPSIRGLFGFSLFPRGRAFVKGILQSVVRLGPEFTLTQGHRVLENYLNFHRGPLPSYKPWPGRRFLETHSCFFREKGWQYNMSVNPVVVGSSCYRLDYHTLYSVWHRSVGLIVNGSQDKLHPGHNTFHGSGNVPGLLHGGRIGSLSNPRWLEALHSSGFVGRIEISAFSKDELRIDVVGRSERQVYFNVPLRVGVGSVIQIGTKKLALTARPVNIPVKPGGKVSIMDGKVAVISDQGGRLFFPCRPYNSYSRDHKSDVSMAFLRLEIPLPDGASKAGIRILVK